MTSRTRLEGLRIWIAILRHGGSAGPALAWLRGGASPFRHILHHCPPLRHGFGGEEDRDGAALSSPPTNVGGEVSRRSRDGEGDNGAGADAMAAQPPKWGMKSKLMKNSFVQYQQLERIIEQIPSPFSHLPSYFPCCPHGTG
jgi:hypothetical protein